jgi:hypothetical protein
MNILTRFSKYLTSIEYPKIKTYWNIAGIIKGQNAFYKFDVRDMFKMPNGAPAQKGNTKTTADKMVFEDYDKWIIIDVEELHKYLKVNKISTVYLIDLVNKLDWNIVIKK